MRKSSSLGRRCDERTCVTDAVRRGEENFRAACFLRVKSAVHRARHLLDMGHQDLTGLASLKVLEIGNFPERLGIRPQGCLGSEGVKRAFACQFHRRLPPTFLICAGFRVL
jgi:hypothetical protein